MSTVEKCNERVNWVACIIDDQELFKSRASEVANELGPEAIETLSNLFHSENMPPKDYAEKFRGLGAWLTARQFAIFEIYYNFKESALPILRQVAYGEYDWTQGNAIEILCRIASEGIDRNEIIAELRKEFPDLRFEAQLYALKPLLQQAESNPVLKEILKELEDLPEYQAALNELSS